MPRSVTQYDLLISCPSDVQQELDIIKQSVEDFNRMYGSANNAFISTKHWSKDSYPQSGGRPQDLLNEQFVLDCDVAVAVFWTRFGTPTDEYSSGTEEEIEELIKSGKQVFLYFSDCPTNISKLDHEQYNKVLAFREKYQGNGIYFTYSSIEDFNKMFLTHLSLHFVPLLDSKDKVDSKSNSNLLVMGVENGEVSDKIKVIQRQFTNLSIVNNLKGSIDGIFHEISEINLPKKITDDIAKQVEQTSIKAQEVKYDIPKIKLKPDIFKDIVPFLKAEAEVVKEYQKEVICKYAQENAIELNFEEFFNLGSLSKRRNLNAGFNGISTQDERVGTDEEKKKYELIEDLYWKIKELVEYKTYFSSIESKYFIDLTLVNCGTHYDEDIDVKIYIEKGFLCTKEQFPVPGTNIIENLTNGRFIEQVFRPKKTVSIKDYDDYPRDSIMPNLSHLRNLSFKETIENNKNNYNHTLSNTFCYEHFEQGKSDIIGYNQKYLKQNTNIYFPSKLVFHDVPEKIRYKITSKHSPHAIEGELIIEK
ncbi:hypothetical protein QJ133_04250 [Priestia megaterium]|uniref:hypothetical protein n=1 Tax=Priestia megaterium TaxID=1404 RepID=UPI00249C97A8|nr:hypothetical protein [Priestia megaterium]MDI3090377.1 hypothetical protein [Priestia megaterium]